MKSVSGKRMWKILENRGWVHDRTRGSHHIYVEPGSQPAVSVHGNRDLRQGT